MSTTFDVYPGTSTIPSFKQLLEESTRELHRFLSSHTTVKARPEIHVSLLRSKDHHSTSFNLDDPLIWNCEKTYAWFQVGNALGGTDACYFLLKDPNREAWENDIIDELWEEYLQQPRFQEKEELIRRCLAVGHYWSFRRSAGQPAAINLAYGLIAGSLAKLTDGFVFSEDGAWDWERMPATPEEFLSWYFVPETALDENKREWSARCIDYLSEELDSRE